MEDVNHSIDSRRAAKLQKELIPLSLDITRPIIQYHAACYRMMSESLGFWAQSLERTTETMASAMQQVAQETATAQHQQHR